MAVKGTASFLTPRKFLNLAEVGQLHEGPPVTRLRNENTAEQWNSVAVIRLRNDNTVAQWNGVAVIRLRNDNTVAQWNSIAVIRLRNYKTVAQWNSVAVTCHTLLTT